MIKPFLTVNSEGDARNYADHIISYRYPVSNQDFKIHVPVGDGISARDVSSEIMNRLSESQFIDAFHISSTYGPDGPTVSDKELVITLTRK